MRTAERTDFSLLLPKILCILPMTVETDPRDPRLFESRLPWEPGLPALPLDLVLLPDRFGIGKDTETLSEIEAFGEISPTRGVAKFWEVTWGKVTTEVSAGDDVGDKDGLGG